MRAKTYEVFLEDCMGFHVEYSMELSWNIVFSMFLDRVLFDCHSP